MDVLAVLTFELLLLLFGLDVVVVRAVPTREVLLLLFWAIVAAEDDDALTYC